MRKNVVFLLPDAVIKPATLFGAVEVLEKANEFLEARGSSLFYNITIAGAERTQALPGGVLGIQPSKTVGRIKNADLIIIPPVGQDVACGIPSNKKLLVWMQQQYKSGAELASLCTGAFFLAATGLLKGAECATHWKAGAAFSLAHPTVKLRTDKIITDRKGIYTAGGAQSSLNLMLHLVEKFNGREAALYCAKVLQIDIDRSSQAPFILFEGQKEHGDEDIRKVQEFIEQHPEARISVEALAGQFLMSRRNMVRRFKTATAISPIEYIQRVKMEAAKRHLERARMAVSDVMFAAGYNDMKAFRTIFKKVTGLSPLEYKMKFSGE